MTGLPVDTGEGIIAAAGACGGIWGAAVDGGVFAGLLAGAGRASGADVLFSLGVIGCFSGWAGPDLER